MPGGVRQALPLSAPPVRLSSFRENVSQSWLLQQPVSSAESGLSNAQGYLLSAFLKPEAGMGILVQAIYSGSMLGKKFFFFNENEEGKKGWQKKLRCGSS